MIGKLGGWVRAQMDSLVDEWIDIWMGRWLVGKKMDG